uniref:Uncharacterized protein n=1 Tax=Peronospora matthiolae TaxID=2874970 RepID=A0AAV1TCH1_9STRA
MKEGKSQVIEVSETKSLVSTKIQHKLERMESSEGAEAEDNNEMGYSTKRSSQEKQKSDDSLEPKAKRQNSEPLCFRVA